MNTTLRYSFLKDYNETIKNLINEKFKDNPKELRELKRLNKKLYKETQIDSYGISIRNHENYIKKLNEELFNELKKKDIDSKKIQSLLQTGADANHKNNSGDYPLHWASMGNSVETINLLISYGADPMAKNSDGLTPLSIAISLDNVEIVDSLIRLGGIE